MTVVVPDPVPLEMPAGDPAALEDFVEDVAGTAYRLAVVGTCLTSPSATAPGWRGADASAAAAQVRVVAGLAEEMSGGVAAAAHRLRAHHELLASTRRRVAVLRAQQDEDFAVAWGRLSGLPDPLMAVRTDAPAAVAVVEALEAAEAARRREHGRLLEELADDSTATARALVEACGVVGGAGPRGGDGAAVAYLAAELPGWGDAELRRRGRDLAEALSGPLSPGERESLARQASAYAGQAAFARTFLGGMGEAGVREVLTLLGDGDLGPTSALARTLALSLGAAVPTGAGQDAVDEVLTATYVDPEDFGTQPDLVALGMGSLLVAGGSAGPRSETVLRWARQILARERSLGRGLGDARAADRAYPLHGSVVPGDPVTIAAQRLTRDDDPAFAAALLGDRRVWDGLLSRTWDDDAAALSQLVQQAGTAGGPVGEEAARAGLEALGAGLADGDPRDWTVDRATAAVVAPALGGAVAANISAATSALEDAAGGELGRRDGDVLRGLGYLTLDEGAARSVGEGLQSWAGAQPIGVVGASPAPAVAVPSAFVAVQEYGQRLAHTLHGFEQQAAAEDRERTWNGTVGVAVEFVRGPYGLGAGLVEGYAAMALDRDGTWENGRDTGLRFDGQDAAGAVVGEQPGDRDAAGRALAAQARAAYDRTLDNLGQPKPPTSPPVDWAGPVRAAVVDMAVDRFGESGERVLRESPLGGWLSGPGGLPRD